MRQLVINLPSNNLKISHLSTGMAVVSLYSGIVEQPTENGMVLTTANVVSVKVSDVPGLEEDILNNRKRYHDLAVAQEIDYLRGQYKKTVDALKYGLSTKQKEAVTELSEKIIRQIAHGDKPFVTQQELTKILKYHI